MKIAFSTLGCPDFDWPDIYSMAKDLGFDGIEIRGLGKDIFAVRARPFTEEELPNTIKKLKELRLEIPCLSSGCCLKFADKAEQNHNEIVQYIELASKLGTPYIRILADLEPQPCGEVDDEAVLAALRRLIPIAEEKGVTLLIETNGVYTDTKRLGELLASAASDAVGALWDVHHPYRFAGESADTTVKNLGAYIKYVHVKDSVMQDGKVSYRMMGEGDLPFDDFMMALRSLNYEGYISLEWVKRWASDLSDAGVVFPHFVNYMSAYIEKDAAKGRLYYNNAKTGQYIWEKDALIDLTFPQVLDRIVEEFPDQYAFRYTTLDYTRTYKEFRDDVDTFARSLIALGVKPGDHVAIWATNVPQWFITFWATTKIGAVVDGQYCLQDIEAATCPPVRYPYPGDDGYKDSNCCDNRNCVPNLKLRSPKASISEVAIPAQYHYGGFETEGCLTWMRQWRCRRRCLWKKCSAALPPSISTMSATCSIRPGPRGSQRASCLRTTMSSITVNALVTAWISPRLTSC